MIKANELRIGNLVLETGATSYTVITPQHIQKCSLMQEWAYPIPLSPEILEKCGGEKDDKSVFGGYLFRLNGGEQIRIVYSDTIGWHWPMFGHTAVIVNFLHQFQNLIFLVDGNELDVKL